MEKTMRAQVLPVFHLAVIVAAYASPWFVRWEYVLVIFVLYRLQFVVFDNCLLSRAQFGREGDTFYYHYAKNIWPRVNRKRLDFITDWIMPASVVILAFLIQH